MEQVKRSDKTQSIEISHHLRLHLEAAMCTAELIPKINQLDFQPHLLSLCTMNAR